MTFSPPLPDLESAPGVRERRCVVTGEVLAETRLVRFVVGPESSIVPDVAAKLPGRGIWVSAHRETLERAVAKGHFARAAKTSLAVPADLPARVEALLVARMSGDLGMARRAGEIVFGFDAVAKAFDSARPPAVLIEASDGGEDGRRKLRAAARTAAPFVLDCLTADELGLALGRLNMVHAALKSGRLSERLTADARRLHGFRPASERVHAPVMAMQDADGIKGQQ